jgi:primase-polymerase (primpol)-like protein
MAGHQAEAASKEERMTSFPGPDGEGLFDPAVAAAVTGRPPQKPPPCYLDGPAVEVLPAELREGRRFVVWAWRWRDGKWTKPPIDPATGKDIDATDPANWTTLDDARRMQQAGDGVGIALDKPDDRFELVAIDWDSCVSPSGDIDPCVQTWLMVLQSYTEVSPSLKGLRTWIKGLKPGPRCKNTTRRIEIYDSDRYLTLTGRHLPGTPQTIEARQDALDALYDDLWPPAVNYQGDSQTPPRTPLGLSDEEVLHRARGAKNGLEFSQLYDAGDLSTYAGDDSAADMALANHLAFWAGRDYDTMERLFTASALGQRDKWRSRRDYRERTLNKAIAECQQVYQPRPAQAWGRARAKPGPAASQPPPDCG